MSRVVSEHPPTLHGRADECASIEAVLGPGPARRFGAVLLLGGAGTGKSALLHWAAARVPDRRVLFGGNGSTGTTDPPFATLHRILDPLLPRLDRLPTAQRRALAAALGLAEPSQPDRMLIYNAVLELLTDAARTRPLLICLDDAQWSDRASLDALLFAGQRVADRPVTLLIAARDTRVPVGSGSSGWSCGLPVLPVLGLPGPAATALLAERAPVPPDPLACAALIEATGGNPQALLDLTAALTSDHLAGREPVPEPVPLGPRLTAAYAETLDQLGAEVAQVLLLASVEPAIGPGTLRAAAAAAGIGATVVARAEADALTGEDGSTLRFRDPLLRAAVQRWASDPVRRCAHRALAAVLDQPTVADRRAWHRAATGLAPDEEFAGPLAQTVELARRRGGHPAAARALSRAAELSTDGRRRSTRLVAAAEHAWAAGQRGWASWLLDRAAAEAVDRAVRGRIELLRGRIERRCGVLSDAYQMLLAAGHRLGHDDPVRAHSAMICAAEAAAAAGHLETATDLLAQLPGQLDARVALLLGTGALYDADRAPTAGALRQLVSLGQHTDQPRTLILAGVAATLLGDDVAARALPHRALAIARAGGADGLLPSALAGLVSADLWRGAFRSAERNASLGLQLSRHTGQENLTGELLAYRALIAALRGDEHACEPYGMQALELADEHGARLTAALAESALALLDLAHERPAAAAVRLARLLDDGPGSGHPVVPVLSIPYLVEAAVRAQSGKIDLAALADRYGRWAQATGATWALALAARLRGLLADQTGAAGHYTEALRLHAHGGRPYDRARTELLYGEWLRRQRQRTAARTQLQTAAETFDRLGATHWAQRARQELRAAGATERVRTAGVGERLPAGPAAAGGTPARLTQQELRIASSVASGATNREVAARLFLSPRTVDYHLRKIFAKLDITSRVELARLELPAPPP